MDSLKKHLKVIQKYEITKKETISYPRIVKVSVPP